MRLLKNNLYNIRFQKASLIGLLFVLLGSCATTISTPAPNNPEVQFYPNYSCSPNSSFSYGSFSIINNQWGKDKIKKGSLNLCTYQYPKNQEFLYGWNFTCPTQSYGVLAYPEIRWGKSIWSHEPAEPNFMRVDEIESFAIRYDAELKTDGGKMNLAADIWLGNDSLAYRKAISTEIMVWEYADQFKSNGKKVAELITSQGLYELRVGKIKRKKMGLEWKYVAFIRKGNRTSGVIPLTEMFDYIIKNGYISQEEYLSSVEFGTELSSSNGSIAFREYSIELNGRAIK